MREKARFVMGVMQDRLRELGEWSRVTAIDVYTALPIDGALLGEILGPAGTAGIHGIRWFPSRPPIQGLEFEVDMRGVARELSL
jgi:hypothetical protein